MVDVYQILSICVGFAVPFFLLGEPRTLLFLVALVVALFVLFGPLALAGAALAVVARLAVPAAKARGKNKKKK
ncbi:hypothetical protein COT29_01115 [Candidatus Micrarchaeota archaeon CG08_land_8_20_14_0_20_59_11]|nr:MAG: hypothetical protein COT29_01115 [Candidatus Micrarchaeota archaeon CG08_land_8_20_14_0_20_59_11]PIT85096.1 MAG: hypothetical protein COU36_05245 [Candidatus Micrarchaeota archaeon CG10_big_fil_rev_8_21_14_0_10_59_7]